MRFNTVQNPLKRKQWEEFIENAHWKMREQKIDLRFTTVKCDGSSARASTVLPSVYFAFAQDYRRKWVELAIKPRTINGERKPQRELYSFLKTNLLGRMPELCNQLLWDEGLSAVSVKKTTTEDLRIKVSLDESDEGKWIEAMVRLAAHCLPFLNRFQSL